MAMLMRSMRRSHQAVCADLSDVEHHVLVTDVFLRGVQHIFYDEDERSAFVNSLASYTDKLPLVPVSVVARVIENGVTLASASVTSALTLSYSEYGEAVKEMKHHDLAARRHDYQEPHTPQERLRAREKPFEHVLRYNMCHELMHLDFFGDLDACLPEKVKYAVVAVFVEELISQIDAGKIEARRPAPRAAPNCPPKRPVSPSQAIFSRCATQAAEDRARRASDDPPPPATRAARWWWWRAA